MKHIDYIEKRPHGSPDFPIMYYYINHEHPRYVMRAHWHSEFEIIRVLEGIFSVHLNNVEHTLSNGDVLFVQGGCLHRGEPSNCVYECLVFNVGMLKRQQNGILEKYLSPIINSQIEISNRLDPAHRETLQIVQSLFSAMRDTPPYYELAVYSLLLSLFQRLYSEKYIVPVSKMLYGHQAQTVMHIIEWIEKNYCEPIDLDKIEVFSGWNKKYLCRIFKEYTSKTVTEFINELRIENACYEISVRGKTITEASYNSGFNDLSYFCKIFKRYTGITAKEYKKQCCP